MCASAYLLKFFFDNDKSLYKKNTQSNFCSYIVHSEEAGHALKGCHSYNKEEKKSAFNQLSFVPERQETGLPQTCLLCWGKSKYSRALRKL